MLQVAEVVFTCKSAYVYSFYNIKPLERSGVIQ